MLTGIGRPSPNLIEQVIMSAPSGGGQGGNPSWADFVGMPATQLNIWAITGISDANMIPISRTLGAAPARPNPVPFNL